MVSIIETVLYTKIPTLTARRTTVPFTLLMSPALTHQLCTKRELLFIHLFIFHSALPWENNLRSGSIFVSLCKQHSGGHGETKREPSFSGSRQRECMRTAQTGPDLRLLGKRRTCSSNKTFKLRCNELPHRLEYYNLGLLNQEIPRVHTITDTLTHTNPAKP